MIYRAAIALVSIGMLTALVYGSLSPAPVDPSFAHADKLLHLGAYLTLCFWHSIVFSRHGLPVLAGCIALGLCLEYLQGLTGYRDPSLYDGLANATGSVLGLILARLSGLRLLRYGAALT